MIWVSQWRKLLGGCLTQSGKPQKENLKDNLNKIVF
jgi:hypothetical protein